MNRGILQPDVIEVRPIHVSVPTADYGIDILVWAVTPADIELLKDHRASFKDYQRARAPLGDIGHIKYLWKSPENLLWICQPTGEDVFKKLDATEKEYDGGRPLKPSDWSEAYQGTGLMIPEIEDPKVQMTRMGLSFTSWMSGSHQLLESNVIPWAFFDKYGVR